MNEKKNLDRLFQEKFKDFEVAPPEFVWDNIQEILEEKKKRRVIPIWFRLSGVAALLVLGGLLATLFFNDAENPAVNAPAVVIDNTTPAGAAKASPMAAPAQSGPSDAGNTNAPQKTTNTATAVAAGDEKSATPKNNNTISGISSVGSDVTLPVANSRNNGVAVQQKSNGRSNANSNASNRNNIIPSKTNNAVAQQGSTIINKSNVNENTADPAFNTAVAATQSVKSPNGTTAVSSVATVPANNNAPANSNADDALAAAKLRAGAKDYAKNPNESSHKNKSNFVSGHNQGMAGVENIASKANGENNNGITNSSNTNGIAAAGTYNASGKNPVNADMKITDAGNTIIDKNIPVTDAVVQAETDSTKVVPENELEKRLQEILKGNKEEDKSVAETKSKPRWNVKPQVAPVFYNSIGQGSPINEQFSANSKSYDNDLSIGLGVNYAVNDRITIRSGVNSVNLSYATNGIAFYASLNDITTNIGTSKAVGNIVVQNPGDIPSDPLLINGEQNQLINGSMVQKTGYIEVPLEMSYAVLNNKFGIDVIGGVSTLFLSQNSVNVVSDTGLTTQVGNGEAQNLNNVHFSTNVGLGFKYRFWDSFQANFEPMFKYQVNAYSRDSGNFKPYFIGLYTGVSFSF